MSVGRPVASLGLSVLVATFVLLTSGCETEKHSPAPPPPPMSKMASSATRSLFDRLGGEPAVTAVVDDFVGRAAGNPKVNFTRTGTGHEWIASPEKLARLKKMLVQFVGMATGGPKPYEGRDMKSVHAGMKITNAEFDAIAGDLKASLDKFHVPTKEQNELMTIVGGTRAEIVEP